MYVNVQFGCAHAPRVAMNRHRQQQQTDLCLLTPAASLKCLIDQTIGKRIAQQQMMSTRCKMSRHVNQDLDAGVFSSKITIATSAQTCMTIQQLSSPLTSRGTLYQSYDGCKGSQHCTLTANAECHVHQTQPGWCLTCRGITTINNRFSLSRRKGVM